MFIGSCELGFLFLCFSFCSMVVRVGQVGRAWGCLRCYMLNTSLVGTTKVV